MFRVTKEPLRCPVGEERIGDRWIHQEVSAFCEDCNATYYWHSHEMAPFKNTKGKKAAFRYCGPDGCFCR